MLERGQNNLYEFLAAFNRFRLQAIRIIEKIGKEGVSKNGLIRLNDSLSLTPSLMHEALHLSLGVGVELEEGGLTWSLDARLTPEAVVVTATVIAHYYDEPYQTIIRKLGGDELVADGVSIEYLNLIVDALLDNLDHSLKSGLLIDIHKQGLSKSFFPNL